jgi:hypothetical protein
MDGQVHLELDHPLRARYITRLPVDACAPGQVQGVPAGFHGSWIADH